MIRRFFSSLLLAVIIFVAAPLSATAAFDPFGYACDANGTNAAVACRADKDPISSSGPKVLILNITEVVAYIAGALAIIMIIVGAIRFITAGSDVSTGSRTDTDIEDARRTITTALLGLAVIVLARVIIFYVVSRL
jgi:hypothetical protein